MQRFAGKVAIVTGAGGGIGAAIAARLTNEGATVAAVDLIAPRGGYAADVADEDAVRRCINSVIADHGQIDVLINNAGVICNADAPDQADIDDWQRVLGVNLIGAVLMIKHASPHLIATKGAIVNTASVAGIRAGAGGNAYSASKAALINLTQTTACDFGADGVRVNAVCPGLIETDMTKPVFDYARSAGKADKLGARCELRRYGHPSEIAAAVAFLASGDASYITGQALAVDGGNTASLNLPGMKF